MTYKQPLPFYARLYRKSLSTIKRYAAAGGPLDQPDEMQTFMAAKKDTGRAGKRAKAKTKTALPDAPVTPGALPGAQHALTRLAEEELQARARLDAAKATKDPDALKLATDLYIKIAESLLRYDRQVDAARRDAGEVVTRAQIEQPVTTLTVWLRRGLEDFINSLSLQLAETDSPQGVYTLIAPQIRLSLGNAVSAACGDGKFPLWLKQAFEAGL